MRVRKIQEKDWEACWHIQRSEHPHNEPFSADTWVFICKNLTDSFVVVDDDDTAVGYWLGMLKINPHEEVEDIWCLAIDVCTHRDHRESGVMDLIMPVATQYHQRIYAFTQSNNLPAEGIMFKWGFNKGKYIEEHNMHYWTYERKDDS